MDRPMVFVSAVTTRQNADDAVQDLVEQVRSQLEESGSAGNIDLAICFLSTHYTYSARQIVDGLRAALTPGVLMGCTAEGVIGRDEEIENEAAITLLAAKMEGVQLSPFYLYPSHEWHLMLFDNEEFRRVVDAPEDTRLFILLGDPFSTPSDDVLLAFNNFYPGIPIAGGMASGALRPGGNVLFLNDQVINVGAVGLALAGTLDVEVVVSQGCRPIWRPFTVTGARKNVIYSIEDKPPLTWLQDLIVELSDDERALLQNGLFVGRAVHSEEGEDAGRGDFLVRGVVAIDRESGSITIGDALQDGEVIQFHVQDALTAQEDLEMMLITQAFRSPPDGGLLFSCNGRGTRLYDHPNGDISIIQKNLDGMQLAGFFCAGEIGPISGENFLHGQTASLALLRSKSTNSI